MTPVLGLLLAIVVEVPLVVGFAVRSQGRRTFAAWLLLGTGANCITYLPFVAAVAVLRPLWGTTASVLTLEVLVALVEGAIYATAGGLGWCRGVALAAAANALSFGVGTLLWATG